MKDNKYAEIGFYDEMVGYDHGQSDLVLAAFIMEKDQKTVVGCIPYSNFNGEIFIKGIDVPEDHRRNGCATKLVQELQRQNPDIEIDWGMLTGDGSVLYDAVPKFKVPIQDIIYKQAQLKEVREKKIEYTRLNDEFLAINTPSVEQREELFKRTADWNDLHDLEDELEYYEFKQHYKVMVDLISKKDLVNAVQAEQMIEKALYPKNKEDQLTLLFHSGTADQDKDLQYIVKPMFGVVREWNLSNAIDDEETMDLIREKSKTSFWSTDPGWVSFKVSQKLDKSVHEVTVDDIRKHGQLCIALIDLDMQEFKQGQVDEKGEPTGYSNYLESDEIADYEMPFGVERQDIYTQEEIAPDITLTGDALIHFLRKNAPGKNIIQGNIYDLLVEEEPELETTMGM